MCEGGTLRESEQLANEGTSINEGWKVVSICLCVRFYWYFWRAKSTVLFECSDNCIIGNVVFILKLISSYPPVCLT